MRHEMLFIEKNLGFKGKYFIRKYDFFQSEKYKLFFFPSVLLTPSVLWHCRMNFLYFFPSSNTHKRICRSQHISRRACVQAKLRNLSGQQLRWNRAICLFSVTLRTPASRNTAYCYANRPVTDRQLSQALLLALQAKQMHLLDTVLGLRLKFKQNKHQCLIYNLDKLFLYKWEFSCRSAICFHIAN